MYVEGGKYCVAQLATQEKKVRELFFSVIFLKAFQCEYGGNKTQLLLYSIVSFSHIHTSLHSKRGGEFTVLHISIYSFRKWEPAHIQEQTHKKTKATHRNYVREICECMCVCASCQRELLLSVFYTGFPFVFYVYGCVGVCACSQRSSLSLDGSYSMFFRVFKISRGLLMMIFSTA